MSFRPRFFVHHVTLNVADNLVNTNSYYFNIVFVIRYCLHNKWKKNIVKKEIYKSTSAC